MLQDSLVMLERVQVIKSRANAPSDFKPRPPSSRVVASTCSHRANNRVEKARSLFPHIFLYFGRERVSPQKAYHTLIFLRLQIDGVKVAFISAQS